MGRLAILALRAVIALMFAGLLVVQGMIIPAIWPRPRRRRLRGSPACSGPS